jgi:hypothetical protein
LYLLKPEKKLLTKSEVGSFCISLSISRKKLDEYKEKVGFPSGNLLNDKIYCSPSFFKDFKSLLYSIASYEDIFRQERFDSCEDDILGFIFELLKNESVEPFRTKVNTRYRVVRRAIEYIDGF